MPSGQGSTGVYGYLVAKAAPIALGAAREFALENPAFAAIRFILFSDEDLGVYQQALAHLEG